MPEVGDIKIRIDDNEVRRFRMECDKAKRALAALNRERWWFRRWKIAVVIAFTLGFVVGTVQPAHAHYYAHCQKPRCKHHVFAPYKRMFLGPVGACESGTGSYSLYAGLHAISPGGTYRGRYQFGWGDWAGAGGHGDPAFASANEQAYRAVVWLHRNGRQSWPNC